VNIKLKFSAPRGKGERKDSLGGRWEDGGKNSGSGSRVDSSQSYRKSSTQKVGKRERVTWMLHGFRRERGKTKRESRK